MCENGEDLIEPFRKAMSILNPPALAEIGNLAQDKLNPPVLAEVGNTARERAKGISVSVINWVATRSEWKLAISKHPDWTKQVVQGWFDPGHTESADAFLERAEAFLQKSSRGESNGAEILHKVIQVE